jgi:hypothetical protein
MLAIEKILKNRHPAQATQSGLADSSPSQKAKLNKSSVVHRQRYTCATPVVCARSGPVIKLREAMGGEMKSTLSSVQEILEEIENELRRSPSFLHDGGKAVDDAEYFDEDRRLELLQARLSLSIRTLQRRPGPLGPNALDLLKYGRKIEKEMRQTWERANTRNIQEVLADATEQIHTYHETTAVPPELVYVNEAHAGLAGSVEAMCLFLFSVVAAYFQLRKRRGKK